jgi:hypothetical protein
MPITSSMTSVLFCVRIAQIELGNVGERRRDRGEDQQRHAVADALLGHQLAEPHDEAGPRRHGDDHDQDRHEVVVGDEVLLAGGTEETAGRAGDGDERRRLQDGETDGQVPRVLRELAGPGLALLLEGLEPRDHHRQQLDDDARRDVRHDPQREHRQLQQRTAAEQVDELVEPVLVGVLDLVDAGPHGPVVDTGRRNERPEPEQRHDRQREQQLAPQVWGSERPDERGEHANLLRAAPFRGGSSWRVTAPVREHQPRSGDDNTPARRETGPGLLPTPHRAGLTPGQVRGAPARRRRHSSVTLPPAAVIFSLADAENA